MLHIICNNPDKRYSNGFHGNINTLMTTLVKLQGMPAECTLKVGWSKHDLSVYDGQQYLRNRKHVPCFYLNNKVFLSRNYRLIVAPRKFDVLKTNTCPRSEASRANMLVLRTSNSQGVTIRPIVQRHKHSIVYFLPGASSKIN